MTLEVKMIQKIFQKKSLKIKTLQRARLKLQISKQLTNKLTNNYLVNQVKNQQITREKAESICSKER